MAAVCVMG